MTRCQSNRDEGYPIRWPGLRRAVAAVGLVLCALTLAQQVAAEPEAAGQSRVFVELFTSQGCSSCPPADRYLGELAKRDGVVAVSMPVDYWDYLGWRDTFGKRIFSQRQRKYAKSIGNGMVYTPQLVIDGRSEMIGSDRNHVETALAKHLTDAAEHQQPDMRLQSKDGSMIISVGDNPDGTAIEATVWLVLFSQREQVEVRGGENGGRSLVYHNVVRELTPIGDWRGAALTLKLPRRQIVQRGADACVAVLQRDNGGPVLAVSAIDRW